MIVMKISVAVVLLVAVSLPTAFSFSASSAKAPAGDDTAKKLREDEMKEGYGVFLKYHQGKTAELVGGSWGVNIDQPDFPMFRTVQQTGVTFATSVAGQFGYVIKSESNPKEPYLF